MKGDQVPDRERCNALTIRGNRCCYRRADGAELCDRHKAGAIVPAGWTQPDNLPIFRLPKARP